MNLRSAAAGVSLAIAGLCAHAAHAETITITCDAHKPFNSPAMMLVYEGDAKGTLTVTSSFGEMRLPAQKEVRAGTDEKGKPISATGILAGGPASVKMPDKSAVESCVRKNLPKDELSDSDLVFMAVMTCTGKTPLADAPIKINASAEIVLEPFVYVGLARTYLEPTDLVVGTIKIEAYPNCTAKK